MNVPVLNATVTYDNEHQHFACLIKGDSVINTKVHAHGIGESVEDAFGSAYADFCDQTEWITTTRHSEAL